MTLLRLFLFYILALSFQPGFSQQIALDKGKAQIKLSEWWLVSNKHFNGDGHKESNIVQYGYYATLLNFQYGLTDRLTGIVEFPFLNYTYFVHPTSLNKEAIWKTGDVNAALEYEISRSALQVKATLLLGFPTGFQEGRALATGDGEFNQSLGIDAGMDFQGLASRSWVSIYSAYNHRTTGFVDEWRYRAEGGIRFSKEKVSVILQVNGVQALGDPENSSGINPQSLFSNDATYLIIQPEINYFISPFFGISIGQGITLAGKNIFAGNSYNIGVFYDTTIE